jgi:hypothetical protein
VHAGAPGRLRVRAAYRLRNSGDRALDSIEAVLPPVAAGRSSLRVTVDGRELVADSPGAADARSIEVPFAPSWPQKQRRELVLEYDLAPGAPGHAGMAAGESAAHLRHFGWYPQLRAPRHLFGEGGNWPEKIALTVRAPEAFLVIAGGRPRGTKRSGGEVEHRFELEARDVGPYVVAGRYTEARVKTPYGEVIFWTLQPPPADAASAAAERLAASWHAYEAAFGKLRRRHSALWIVETPARLAPHGPQEAAEAPAGIGFPDGALLNSRAFALGVSSGSFLELAEHELAHAWFGQTVLARREADVLLTEALAEHATLVAAEARGGEAARRRHGALLLRWYDEHRRNFADTPLVSLRPDAPWEQRVFGYNKGALFYLALEDELGKEPVRRALARLIHAMGAGGTPPERASAGLHELRAAMEGETGRDLAGFFRAWLNRPGIPDDFRARYEMKAESRE